MNKIRITAIGKLFFVFALLFLGGYGTKANAEVVKTLLAKVVSAPTGEGKVYISEQKTDSPSSQVFNYDPNPNLDNAWKHCTRDAYLYAIPDSGYVFNCWTGDGKTENNILLSRQACPFMMLTHNNSRTDSTSYIFTAHFAKAGALTAASANESLGTVGMDNISNKLGEKVTLTAYPDLFAASFAGWMDADSNMVSTEKTLTVTVTDSTKYIAVFDSLDMKNTGFYARLVPMNDSNRYEGLALGLAGISEKSMDSLYSGQTFGNSLIIAGGKKMHSSPSFVIRLTGTPNGYGGLAELDGSVQGHKLTEIIGQAAEGTVLGMAKINEYSKTLYLKEGEYVAYFANNERAAGAMEEGFDTVSTPTLFGKQIEKTGYRWEVMPITETDTTAYFGAWPQSSKQIDGRYLTTMYTAFPYKCLDGVEAYTVQAVKANGEMELKKIESGVVPKYTAVILSCLTQDPKTNRLLPLLDESQEPITGNLLKGEIWVRDVLNGKTDSTFQTFRKAFDADNMRILSNNLDFNKNWNGTYIANNTAYLDVSGQTRRADSYYLPEHFSTDINTISAETGLDNNRSDGRIYNLSGQYVGNSLNGLPRGIYISNGKKIVK